MADFRFTGYHWDEKVEEEALYQYSKLKASLEYRVQLSVDQGYLYKERPTPMCFLASDMIEAGVVTPAKRVEFCYD